MFAAQNHSIKSTQNSFMFMAQLDYFAKVVCCVCTSIQQVFNFPQFCLFSSISTSCQYPSQNFPLHISFFVCMWVTLRRLAWSDSQRDLLNLSKKILLFFITYFILYYLYIYLHNQAFKVFCTHLLYKLLNVALSMSILFCTV